MKSVIYVILLSSLLSFSKSMTDSEVTVIPLSNVGLVDISSEREFDVVYRVMDDDVYVECYLNDFTFTEEKVGSLPKEGEGHLRLYKNDEHIATIFSGAFIIKGLSEGEHELKLIVVHNDHTSYDLEKEFKVTI